ncbi:hypothetical protein FRC07_010478 [Ceratobasidium sp. 392]|nr:hypothetical protein FRC07_010478 [Ceratobasidium sp. 392]
MVHSASSTESDWFLPYDGPIEPPPPPPIRHPFAAEISQLKPVPATAAPTRSKSNAKSDRSRSRSRSRDAKRKSQRSYIALDAGGGVGAYPAPESREQHRDREKERSSVQSDFTFGAHSAHTFGANSGHTRGQGSLPPATVDPQYTFPPTDDSTISTGGGKTSDPPLVFANHPFRMHTGSPPPRSHTASASLSTPWVRTIASSPVPTPAPMRKRTLTYQPGLVSSFGSIAETRVGYHRESGAFLDLDAREREKIRPTLLPPSLSLLGKPSRASVVVGEGGLRGLACFPRARVRSDTHSGKDKEKERSSNVGNRQFQTVEEVLRDRDQLEKEREEWNALGQGSLLNNRTRSLSRSQSRAGGGGARVGGARPRRETVAGNGGEGGSSGWGTLKLKRSVEMLAATALSQGHGHAPSGSVSSSHRRGGTLGSVSTVSHVRGASTSAHSRAHSRADSWGQRVVCGSRSASSLGDDAAASPGGHMGQSSEVLLRGPRRPVEDYPVVDIRPIPVGDTHRARAPPPPPQPSVPPGFGIAGPSSRGQQTMGNRLSPGPNYATLHPIQPPPSPGDSVIGLALSSPANAGLVLPNHPFAHRAGAHPAMEPPAGLPTGPETIATRHRHPPRSSGSTERARLDEPNEIRPSRSVPPIPTKKEFPPLQMKFPMGPSKSAPPQPQPEHPFVVRQTLLSNASGEVQRMFENAMLKSAVLSSGGREWDPRRGSGDSGLGSSVNDHGVEMYRGGARKVSGSSALAPSSLRGSVFGPPAEFEDSEAAPVIEVEEGGDAAAPADVQPTAGEPDKGLSPHASGHSPYSLMDSLSPVSRRSGLTRVSSGMIDPALAGMTSPMLSHESSSSSFSSPRPLASIDDIESLRGIFYRPSPVPDTTRLPTSQEGSPLNEPVLDDNADSSESEEYGEEKNPQLGGGEEEDWTFGRRPLIHGRQDSDQSQQLLWERRLETSGTNDQQGKTPLRIDLAPGTPSPTISVTASLPPPTTAFSTRRPSAVPRSTPAASQTYQDVPESVHDSDSQSERSVFTTSSQRATNENLTFGFVRSAQVDSLDVSVVADRHSTALSLIDMYDYDVSVSSSSPNTPQNYPAPPSPYSRPTDHTYLSPASAGLVRPLISGFPTPPADGTPMSSSVLSTYFAVDNQTSSRRSADERSCS